jgi:transposase-like protein
MRDRDPYAQILGITAPWHVSDVRLDVPAGTVEVVAKLRQADEALAKGTLIAEVARSLGVSEVTLHRWRAEYGAVDRDAVKRLKDLEKENTRLKRLVADQQLDLQILKEIAKGEF